MSPTGRRTAAHLAKTALVLLTLYLALSAVEAKKKKEKKLYKAAGVKAADSKKSFHDSSRGEEESEGSHELEEKQCAPGCKPLFIGDKNCDPECDNRKCNWDGGDCKDKWELRRMVVMGDFYESVDHVEYLAVAPGGKSKQLTMEQGRKWEGIELGDSDAPDWRKLVTADDDEDAKKGGTLKGKVWHSDDAYIGPRGEKPTSLF